MFGIVDELASTFLANDIKVIYVWSKLSYALMYLITATCFVTVRTCEAGIQ